MAIGIKQLGGRTAAAILLAALAPTLSFGQLHSRPASVMLIATLESLSVRATPAAIEVPSVAGEAFSSHSVEVTTSWAVPARCTTLRLVGGLSDESRAQRIESESWLSASGTVAPKRMIARGWERLAEDNHAPILKSGDAGLTLMTQAAGESNRADSRTNRINLELGRRERLRAGSGTSSATLSIRIEAL